MFAASSSEGKQFIFAQVCFHAKRLSWFSIIHAAFENPFEKRRTVEMTWGETATDKLKETTRRDNKVAVSPSRPLNCSPPPFIVTRSVKLCLSSTWFSPRPSLPPRPFGFTPNGATTSPPKFFDFQKYRRRRAELNRSIRFERSKVSALPFRRRRTTELTWAKPPHAN